MMVKTGAPSVRNRLSLLLSLLLALCMCVGLGTLLSACGEHEHTPDDGWSNNDTHHWKLCDADTCTEELEKAEHAYEISVKTDSKHTWACVCGKAYMEDHRFGVGTVVQEAAKGTTGIVEYVCEDCQYKKTTYVQYEPKTTVNAGDAADIMSLEGVTKYTLDIDGDYELIGAGVKATYVYDGTTIFEDVDSTGDNDWYWTLEDNTPYQYYKYNNTTWVKNTDQSTRQRYQARMLALQALIYDIDFVDDLDYNEQGKYYGGSFIEAVFFRDLSGGVSQVEKVYDSVKIYFEDDKLVRMEFEKDDHTMMIHISYDEVAFTVPTVQ